MKRQKITLQYKCRRCGERYHEPKINFVMRADHQMPPALMTTLHDCNDNEDKTRFGIADLIGCKVEKE